MKKIEKHHIVKAINIDPLPGKTIAPPLVKNQEYPVRGITFDKDQNQHIDVGLKSEYEYITSHETGERLPNGDIIHWCHPSRFEIVEGKTNNIMQFLKEDSY